jgi:hypothetical protein
MLTETKSKLNFKRGQNTDLFLRSLASFEIDQIELYVKYRVAIYEYRSEVFRKDDTGFRYTPKSGVFSLSKIHYLKGPFHTRMIFEKCDASSMTDNVDFNRWIKIRDIMLFNAMLFIKDGDDCYRLTKDRGPLQIPLLNKHYYPIVRLLSHE